MFDEFLVQKSMTYTTRPPTKNVFIDLTSPYQGPKSLAEK